MTNLIKRLRVSAGLAAFAAVFAVSTPGRAGIVAFDGGVTLWVSYDNLDAPGATLADTITEADSLPDGFSCGPTNTGRADVGAPNSPASCPGATGSCSGEEKVTGDITKLADYIYQASEGAHYLRRVYVSDEGRAWDSADIKWNMGVGGSSAPFGWANSDLNLNLNSSYRTCIHDVIHHELGHYLYNLPDRYERADGYYQGTIAGDATVFDVDVTGRDINTVMSNNFPHLFVDTTNASITVDYDPPGAGAVTGEVLTPALLSDGDASNDGPNRAHHGHTNPFAQDEWSLLPSRHADLTGVHAEGTFAAPGATPAVDIVIIGDDEPHPGTALLLDRSGSMGVTTNGITAAQYVQEAGMFLYHSAEDSDLVGTYLYNAAVEELFPYAEYDPANDLPFASFRTASGLTDIAEALETAIDALIAEHGEGGVSGAEIYLMSDGRQTTGASLWDQVTRANERGIKIHTFSFGDADETTMNDIASGSGGDTTPMSERDDAAELKMLMTRKFSTGRGMTPVFVFKGAMRDKINLGATQLYVGQFSVPPKTRGLQFYTFLHQGDASQTMTLQLKAPSGAVFNSPPPNNVAQKGRFNGVKIDKPESGLWTFTIIGVPGSGLPSEPIEIAAYADNRELKGNVWFDDVASDGDVILRARLNFRYPLTNMNVVATIYAAGSPTLIVPMVDDGATGGDERAQDGVYSARLNLGGDIDQRRFTAAPARLTGKLRIEVEFDVSSDSYPAPFAHYETGFTPAMASNDYNRGNKSAFKAWATTVLNLADTQPDQPNRRPGFGDDPDGDPVKTPRGENGKLGFTLLNARPLPTQLRVSLGQGVTAKIAAVQDAVSGGRKPRLYKKDKKNSEGDVQKQPSKDADRRRAVDSQKSARLAETARPRNPPAPVSRAIQDLARAVVKPPPETPVQTRYVVHYSVADDAKPGPRSLLLQFGETILEKPNAMTVGK